MRKIIVIGTSAGAQFLILTLATLSMAACSGGKSISRDEVRSGFRSASSFTAEIEVFIDFVLQKRSTRPYAEEHAAYLKDEIEQSARELGRAEPEPDAKEAVRECRGALGELARELNGIRAAARGNDRDALVAARARTRQIRESLETSRFRP